MNELAVSVNVTQLPGIDAVGSGYDVNGVLADPQSLIGQPLFDFGKETTTLEIEGREFSYPTSLHVTKVFRSDYLQESSQDIESYREQVGLQVGVKGKYKLFSGSLDVAFSSSDQRQTQTYFCATRAIHRLWIITIPGVSSLKKSLTPEFKRDLDDPGFDPRTLFERYGAYYVAEIVVGGRLDYTSATKVLNTRTTVALDAVAQSSYRWLVGEIEVSSGSQLAKDIESYRSNSQIRLTAIGGKPGLSDQILYGPERKRAFGEWSKSLIDYASMMGFTNESLRPIWELASDPARQAQIEAAFAKFMAESAAGRTIPKTEQVLAVNSYPSMIPAGTDAGSGAKQDLGMFVPSVSGGYYWVAEYGQQSHGPCGGRTPIFKDVYDLGLLKPPLGWQAIWTDAGSGKSSNYACWRAIPPQGYRAIGDVLVLGTSGLPQPSDPGYMCVHESLCADVAELVNPIWYDRGTGAHKNLQLWRSKTPDCVYSDGAVGVPNHHNPVTKDDLDALKGVIACVKQKVIIPAEQLAAVEKHIAESKAR
jgi:hypothetical protein